MFDWANAVVVWTKDYSKMVKNEHVYAKDLGQFLKEKIENTKKILNAIDNREQALASINKQYNEDVDKFRKDIKEIMKTCSHDFRIYHPDPSGNNDSYYSCDICGDNV